jgi:thiol-disulfide isomerase/thioredoxin
MVRPLLFAIAVLLAGATAWAGTVTERMHVGDRPPDFLGRDTDGSDIRLSADPGKVTVITFWATWCGPCLQELPLLEAAQEVAGPERLRIIAINFQEDRRTVTSVRRDLSKFQITFAYDPGGRVASAFGINAIPHMYMLDKRGRIARIRVGYGEASSKDLADDLNRLLAQH